MVIALLPSQSAVEGPVTACRPWTRRSPPPPDRGSTSGAGSEDVLVVDRGCHAIHAAGDAIAVRSPLELGDLAALESACLRDGCEGEYIVSHHPSRQHQAARRRGPVGWTAECRTEECVVINSNPKGHPWVEQVSQQAVYARTVYKDPRYA